MSTDNVLQELKCEGLSDRLPQSPVCKVCSSKTNLFTVLDFNAVCLANSNYKLGLLGVPIYYHRCSECGLIYTYAFDKFTSNGWIKYIYNDEYFTKLDTGYGFVRPSLNAEILHAISIYWGKSRTIGVDYGGGNGMLSQILRKRSIAYYTYDPFDLSDIREEDIGKFNILSAFEVLEHTIDPIGTFKDILRLAADKFVFVASTQCSHDLVNLNTHDTWWYVAPRNGHVSIYTVESLQQIANQFQLDYISVSRGLHLFGRGVDLPQLKYLAGLIKLKQRILSKLK